MLGAVSKKVGDENVQMEVTAQGEKESQDRDGSLGEPSILLGVKGKRQANRTGIIVKQVGIRQGENRAIDKKGKENFQTEKEINDARCWSAIW